MADNACFGVHGSGYGSFLTYMAGCTDPDYDDASCPDKHGFSRWLHRALDVADPLQTSRGSHSRCAIIATGNGRRARRKATRPRFSQGRSAVVPMPPKPP